MADRSLFTAPSTAPVPEPESAFVSPGGGVGHAEAPLSRAFQSALFNSVNVASIATDTQGVIQIFNAGAERMLGYTAAEIINRFTPADISDSQEAITRAAALSLEFATPVEPGFDALVFKAARGLEDIYELTYIRKDGSPFPVVVSVTALRDARDVVIGYLLIGRDNTAYQHAEQALQRSQQRLRDIIDGLGPSMFVGLMTPQGVMLEVNRPALAACGLKPDDVLGKRFDETYWWTHSLEVQQQLREAIARGARGEASRYDVQVRGAPNGLIDVDFSLQPLRNEAGEVVFLVPSASVITERKQTERALRESDQQFHQLTDNITDAFWIRSPDMREVHYVSPAFERIWGRTAESLYANPHEWTDFIVPEDRERVLGVFAGLTGDAASVGTEYRIARPDGEIRWVRARGFQVRDSADKLIRLTGIVTDITEQRRAAEALRTSMEEFRTLAEAMPQIVWITRPDGWNIYFNQQWVDYTGLTLEESHGHGWNKPFHPDDQQRAWDAWQHATATVGPYVIECRLRRADGVYRWWLIRGAPAKDAAGNIVKWFGTCTDIHDLKLAQLDISHANRALKMLSACNETLIRAKDEQGLLDDVCRIAVEDGGYRMAWVGYAQDDASRSITPLAYAGAEEGALSEIKVTWNEHDPLGQGPSGQVIRTGHAVVCEDLTEHSPLIAWLALARQRGCRGVISLPLRDAKRTFGLLALYSAEVTHTGAEELTLLQQVADNVAFGIASLRARSERRRLQADVVKSEERYRLIVETTNEGISILDAESAITFANRRFADMLGYRTDELIGKSLFQIVPEAAGAAAALRVERSRQGITEEQEVSYVRKDGSEVWALLKTNPIRDADGKWLGTLGMLTDRTHYRTAEEALRKSEEEYRQIVETTTDGVIKVDSDAVIVFVNRRFAEMLGYQPSEMIGVSLFGFMDADAKLTVSQSLQNRRRGLRGAVDTKYRHKDGSSIAVNVAGSPLLDREGRHIGSLGVVRDVTEQKKMQSQLMVSDRMASVGTLAAGVAHEINNPLAAVIANLDYMAESLGRTAGGDSAAGSPARSDAWLLEEIKGPLDDAREAAQRVRFIVRDLKIFSRSPIDKPKGAVDVKAIMESALRMAWNEIRHRARLVKDYGHVPGVNANEARLGQVFLNLVVNAAQAVPEGRAEHNEIRVTTRLEGERVLIEIKDTGPGIPPEIIGRIFDAFFTTKGVGVGTGLGLAICQRIVTDMGGELTVESEVGKGATFRVALPVAREEETKEEQSTGAPPVEPVAVTGRCGRLLLVDDEEVVLRSLKRILAKEHDIVAVSSAREALALCAGGEKFDLILCDLMMPEMTGMDLYRELSRVAPGQADRMIFVTGGAFTDKAQHFLSDTSKEHIEKPFHAANLRAIVQRYLRS